MKIRKEASPQKVREFYESDLPRRVRARIDGNRRIDRAVDFMLPRIDSDSRVLDIGCGIGVATERIAAAASNVEVFAVDISPAHIDYCQRTVDAENITFKTVDVIADFDELEALVDGDIDVVTMVDVIEHLPRPEGREFFEKLGRLLSDEAKILLTYPSPQYQRHLYGTDGARIQAVDLVLELDDIAALADCADCQIRHFSYVDVWRRDQYIHCELAARLDCERFEPFDDWSSASLGSKAQICSQFLRQKARKVLRPIRKRKYILSPSEHNDSP